MATLWNPWDLLLAQSWARWVSSLTQEKAVGSPILLKFPCADAAEPRQLVLYPMWKFSSLEVQTFVPLPQAMPQLLQVNSDLCLLIHRCKFEWIHVGGSGLGGCRINTHTQHQLSCSSWCVQVSLCYSTQQQAGSRWWHFSPRLSLWTRSQGGSLLSERAEIKSMLPL